MLVTNKAQVVIRAMIRRIGVIRIALARTWAAACSASKRARWKIVVIVNVKTCSAIFKL